MLSYHITPLCQSAPSPSFLPQHVIIFVGHGNYLRMPSYTMLFCTHTHVYIYKASLVASCRRSIQAQPSAEPDLAWARVSTICNQSTREQQLAQGMHVPGLCLLLSPQSPNYPFWETMPKFCKSRQTSSLTRSLRAGPCLREASRWSCQSALCYLCTTFVAQHHV
jgi:hypothetical protein